MHQRLARYHARSPRYTLNTDDDSLIRVAGPLQVPWEEGTEIRNVSLTGLAFTAPDDLAPLIGEVIRIQFQIPGGQQSACYAIVTRLEEDKEKSNTLLVAVHFYKMDMSLRILLAQGLSKKFRDQVARKGRDGLEEITFSMSWRSFLFMCISLGLWAALMILFLYTLKIF